MEGKDDSGSKGSLVFGIGSQQVFLCRQQGMADAGSCPVLRVFV